MNPGKAPSLIVKGTNPDMPSWAGFLRSLTAGGVPRLITASFFQGLRSLKANYKNVARWRANGDQQRVRG
jgi:hypothetical protein